MGQVNLPVLNRSGIYDYWDVSTESTIRYNYVFFESIFIRKLFFFSVYDRLSYNMIYFNKDSIFKKINILRFKNKIKSVDYLHKMNNFFFKFTKVLKILRKLPFFLTKVFFIKYCGWIITTIRIYMPLSKVYKRRFGNKPIYIINRIVKQNFFKLYLLNEFNNKHFYNTFFF